MEREYVIIMYKIKKKINLTMERELGKVLRKRGFKFIGNGYDFTNKRQDVEFRKEIKNDK